MAEKYCAKCGRECAEDQAFCGECLADMEKYPVKPGVVVLLPPQTRPPKAPSRRRREPLAPEKQIAKMKKQIIALWLSLILALSTAGAMGWLVIRDYLEEEASKLQPGQNYSSEDTMPPEKTD